MEGISNTGDRTTEWIRRIARIWSTVIIGVTVLMLAGYAVNWVTTGRADPHAADNYPLSENLAPLTLVLSVLGLAIGWRWEGLGGAVSIGFFLAGVAVHFLVLSPRPYPYPVAIALIPPGVFFLVGWRRSRKAELSGDCY